MGKQTDGVPSSATDLGTAEIEWAREVATSQGPRPPHIFLPLSPLPFSPIPLRGYDSPTLRGLFSVGEFFISAVIAAFIDQLLGPRPRTLNVGFRIGADDCKLR